MFLSAPKQVIREVIVLQFVATDSHRQMELTPSKPGKRWFGVEVTLAPNFTIAGFLAFLGLRVLQASQVLGMQTKPPAL